MQFIERRDMHIEDFYYTLSQEGVSGGIYAATEKGSVTVMVRDKNNRTASTILSENQLYSKHKLFETTQRLITRLKQEGVMQ